MVPMRSVPHRVVCLVGLDDGRLPAHRLDRRRRRAGPPPAHRRARRRAARTASCCSTRCWPPRETLVITYTGANEHSGATAPPGRAARRDPRRPRPHRRRAGPRPGAGPPPAAAVRRPQPRCRRPSPASRPVQLRPGRPRGCRARRPGRAARVAAVPGRTAAPSAARGRVAGRPQGVPHPPGPGVPARTGSTCPTPLEADEVGDAIPIDLDALELWGVGDRLLREVMAGQDPTAVMTAEQLRGTAPARRPRQPRARRRSSRSPRSSSPAPPSSAPGDPRSVDVDVDLGDGRRLTGTVSGIYGTRIVSLGYSRPQGPPAAALLARPARPDRRPSPTSTGPRHAVGKDRAGPKRALAGPLDHRAVDWLRDAGRAPRPGAAPAAAAPLNTAHAWAEAHALSCAATTGHPRNAAAREWDDRPQQQLRHPGRGRRRLPTSGSTGSGRRSSAARRRAADLRLADLGAAADRRREGWRPL